MSMSFKWNKPESTIIKERINDKAQLFMANEARKLMAPYVPELGHVLVKNTRVYLESGEGVVEYMSPYARYQFGGKLFVSSKTGSSWSHGEYKVPTNRDLKYTKPTASSHWEKAMLTAHKDDLVKAVQNYIKLNGG